MSKIETPEPAAPPADHSLVITRLLDAPRDLVYKVWTEPEHLGRWWGPRGFTTTTHAIDVRPGGEWIFIMHGPDGTDYPNRIVFETLDGPERLVYRHAGEQDGDDDFFHTTVTFEEVPGGQTARTRITMTSVFASTAARDEVIRKYGAVEGGISTLERLGEHLDEIQAGSGPLKNPLTIALPSDREIVLARTFDAPRALVFEAWTRPEHMRHWYGCHAMEMPVCEIDLRVGGAYRWVLKDENGEYGFHGEYREVSPPERLVYTEIFEAFPDNEALNTVTFTEEDGRTTLRNTVLHPSKESRDGHLASGMETGAAETLDRLEEYVAKQPKVA